MFYLGCSGGASPPQGTGSNEGRIPYYQHFAFWWTLLFELFHSSPFLLDLPPVCPAPGSPSRTWTSEQCTKMFQFGQQWQKKAAPSPRTVMQSPSKHWVTHPHVWPRQYCPNTIKNQRYPHFTSTFILDFLVWLFCSFTYCFYKLFSTLSF